MKRMLKIYLAVPLGILLAPTALASWVLVDDMESGDNWTGDGSVVADPTNASNNVYAIVGSGNANDSEAYQGIPAIANDTTATLFFRMRTTGYDAGQGNLSDWVGGASDVAAPDNSWGNFEGYTRISEDGDPGDVAVDVRNGGGFSEVGKADVDVWYNFWLVLNNTADTTSLYYNTGGEDATSAETISFADAGFRNGTTDALVSLYLRNNENLSTGFLDDVYIDLSGENLVNPAPVPEPTASLLLGVGLLATLKRRRK